MKEGSSGGMDERGERYGVRKTGRMDERKRKKGERAGRGWEKKNEWEGGTDGGKEGERRRGKKRKKG